MKYLITAALLLLTMTANALTVQSYNATHIMVNDLVVPKATITLNYYDALVDIHTETADFRKVTVAAILNGDGGDTAFGTIIAFQNYMADLLVAPSSTDSTVFATRTYVTTVAATKQPLDGDLTTIAGLTATTDNFIGGASSAWASRTPAQVKTSLSLNNVENTALSTWVGSTNITTLGTIATGVWSGTAILDAKIASAATWNAKQNAITTGTTAQYFKGDLSLGTFATDVRTAACSKAYLSSAFTTSSTTSVDITGLSFAIGANEVWYIDCYMQTTKDVTSGMKFGITGPASSKITCTMFGAVAAGNAFIADELTDATPGDMAVTFNTTTGNHVAHFTGTISTGASSGTVQMQVRSVTSGTVTINKWSSLVATKLN